MVDTHDVQVRRGFVESSLHAAFLAPMNCDSGRRRCAKRTRGRRQMARLREQFAKDDGPPLPFSLNYGCRGTNPAQKLTGAYGAC
jgi:hypothetical protein